MIPREIAYSLALIDTPRQLFHIPFSGKNGHTVLYISRLISSIRFAYMLRRFIKCRTNEAFYTAARHHTTLIIVIVFLLLCKGPLTAVE